MSQVEHLREQVHQLEAERASLLHQLEQAHRTIAQEREAFLASRITRVLYLVRQEGPTSEAFVGFTQDADIDAWLTAHRTDRWVHLVLAVLRQPDEFV